MIKSLLKTCTLLFNIGMSENDNKNDQARPDNDRAFLKQLKDAMPNPAAYVLFFSVAIAGITADLYSKSAIFDWLFDKPPYPVIEGFLTFVIVLNDGAAFNILGGKTDILVIASFVALVAILGIFLFGNMKHTLANIALGMFAAGICGNLYDRLFNEGLVRDFIDVVYWPGKHWPAFNIADSLLCVGVGLMIISIYLTDRPCQKHDQQQK